MRACLPACGTFLPASLTCSCLRVCLPLCVSVCRVVPINCHLCLTPPTNTRTNSWYDGQLWVKTPQILMRDRLMSNYTVKPALARLKRTLLGLGGALVASVVVLAAVPPPPVNSASYYAYDSTSSSYVSSTAASTTSSSSSSGAADYEASVAKYEPWAAGQESAADGDAAPAFDMRSHMMTQ